MRDKISMNANPIVKHLKKHNSEFSKQDLIKFCEDKSVEMVKFLFVGGDGKLKSLNFMITSRWHLDEILSYGERLMALACSLSLRLSPAICMLSQDIQQLL